jgi:hypothetical protein
MQGIPRIAAEEKAGRQGGADLWFDLPRLLDQDVEVLFGDGGGTGAF